MGDRRGLWRLRAPALVAGMGLFIGACGAASESGLPLSDPPGSLALGADDAPSVRELLDAGSPTSGRPTGVTPTTEVNGPDRNGSPPPDARPAGETRPDGGPNPAPIPAPPAPPNPTEPGGNNPQPPVPTSPTTTTPVTATPSTIAPSPGRAVR